VDIVDELIQGREAFRRHEWRAARDRLSAPDPATLDPADLHALSTAAYLVGDIETCVRAWQRSYQVHEESGDHLAAARDALWLTFALNRSGNEAAGKGWLARAARLLDAEPDDVAERGFLLMHQTFEQIFSGHLEDGFEMAVKVAEAGHRHGEPDLVTVGLVCQGRMLLYFGRVPEGLGLLDEAMAGVAAGEVSPLIAGTTYCAMIDACQEIDDYRRMTDWTRMLTHWCDQQPDLVAFTGQSAVHRAQIMRVQGAWSDALEELELAQTRYEALGLAHAIGDVHYERGEVLRLQGGTDAAAASYDAAAGSGHDPQPGLGLLWLAQGRIDAAVAVVRRLLDEASDPVHRSQVLSAVAEVLVAGGDLDGAADAAAELDQIATSFGSAALSASAAYARGSVVLARSEPTDAVPHLRQAWRTWLDLGARYHAAWARARIGQAFRALGDEDSARAELVVAGRTFDELGAVPARVEVERLLGGGRPDGLTAREIEVLRLVAAGRTNPQIAVELFLSEKTVARHLSNIFGKTNVTSRTAAAAYAFQHQLA
jgi:DNA-binding CsgD family transcriptional regulator/tetratricopeptide (TPR) repeat protein